ncbi:TIGR04104 family putative zinc finger protein [Halalkalibacter hemicellulosilyticus]|uniref:TIGR04104 family putative zinc finger protein n=1 Tax=Halalkalibacter hemicellulosilyticus TaxID=127886 RepID=UPI00054FDD5C
MSLPKCWSCQYTFKYKEALTFLAIKQCPNCQKKQYLTSKSNLKTGIPPVLIMLIPGFILRLFVDISFILYMSIIVGLFVLAVLALPFSYEFTKKKEPLF